MKQKKKHIQAVTAPGAPRSAGHPARRIAPWCAALLLLAALVAVGVALNRPAPGAVPSSVSLQVFVPARVTAVYADNASPDTWTEGLRLGEQALELEILSGVHKGVRLPVTNYLSAYYNVDLKEGSRAIVRLDTQDDGTLSIASLFNFDRGPLLGGFVLCFCLLVVLIGGKKGIMAVLGLAFTLATLWLILLPLIMRGADPILAAVLIVALTAGVSLLLLNGFSLKTLCATLGCVGGVAAAGLAAALVGHWGHISGFNMEDAEALVLVTHGTGLSIRGLLVCGILISALGAVMDVAMAIASAVHEVAVLNPALDASALFRSGMNIGRDAMGTMTNTLILAFVGSSLNTLLLFRIYEYPLLELLNSDFMCLEILQGVSGSIGIVLTVPLVAFVSAQIMAHHRRASAAPRA